MVNQWPLSSGVGFSKLNSVESRYRDLNFREGRRVVSESGAVDLNLAAVSGLCHIGPSRDTSLTHCRPAARPRPCRPVTPFLCRARVDATWLRWATAVSAQDVAAGSSSAHLPSQPPHPPLRASLGYSRNPVSWVGNRTSLPGLKARNRLQPGMEDCGRAWRPLSSRTVIHTQGTITEYTSIYSLVQYLGL